jgi:Fe-Mn family superoxide dismutase
MGRRSHALPGDYGAAAGAYVDAFMDNIDWRKAYRRYQQAVHAASESLGIPQEGVEDALLVDVRREAVYRKSPATIGDAEWRDPARVSEWARELPTDRKVVVYCVYGHEVGRATAMRLRAAGIDAGFLLGGHDGWR